MSLDILYDLLKIKREEMYTEGKTTIEFSQAEFFELFQMICYLKQIKHIMDDM